MAGFAGTEKYDFVFKFIIIGDTGTGKSCILHQFVDGKCKVPPSSSARLCSRASDCSAWETAA